MQLDRRRFLSLSGLTALQLAVLGCRSAPVARASSAAPSGPFGPLVSRPDALLDLPAGFTCVRLQRAGTNHLDDGRPVPGCLDGMACFAAPDGTWVLLRNHEIGDDAWVDEYKYTGQAKIVTWGPDDRPVDPRMHGGVSRLVVDPEALRRALSGDAAARPLKGAHMALTGTECNCAGGRLPEGWVSCEETDTPGHGYAWLVSPDTAVAPRRLDTWGRLRREGVAVHGGCVYMTEDHDAACFYRFRPTDPADLFGPGTLEVLCLPGRTLTHRKGERMLPMDFVSEVEWRPVPDPQAVSTPCREQVPAAARFHRTEGIAADAAGVWFVASLGGPRGKGQLFRLEPGLAGAPERLRLVLQVEDPAVLAMPDNLCLTPWGDLLLCEDNYVSDDLVTAQHLRALTPDGALYELARNPQNRPIRPGEAPGDEFTGACFSPDGSVLFVNLQGDRDETLAISGPWPKRG